MPTVLVERAAAWRRITLNRPDRINAFTGEMHTELLAALNEAAADGSCRAVLLTGAGRGFCAGQDLADAETMELGDALERFYIPLVRRIRSMPKPVVCAVNGVAAGAGANVALACDIVLAGRAAKFTQAFVRIGLIPDAGGTWLLPRLVGEARARGLAMTGEAVSGEDAAAWGMIWRAVDDDALMPEAEALTARLAALPTQAIALMKRAFDASAHATLDEQLHVERDLQRAAGATPDFKEGVRAFLEKRPARFTGRPA